MYARSLAPCVGGVFPHVPRSLVTLSAAVCLSLIYAVCLLILDLHISLFQEL